MTVKKELHDQRKIHDYITTGLVESGTAPEPTSIAENVPETLTIADQMTIAQKKMTEAFDNKSCKSPGSVNVYTPYGKVKTYSQDEYEFYQGFYEQLADSYPESDKIGQNYLKDHNIETEDTELSGQITEYYVSLAVSACIEREKKLKSKETFSDSEYKEARRISQERLHNAIDTLNKKGFIVNHETGELEYRNNQIQMNLLTQRSR